MNDKLEFFYDHSDDVCFRVDKTQHAEHPFAFAVDNERGGFEEMLLSTAEAKALLKFLKKHLEIKLENV